MSKPFRVRRSLDVEDALNSAVHRTEILGPALDASDLDEAIDLLQRARAVAANDHAAKPSLLFSLGDALRDRFVRFGRVGDLEEAVEVYRLAVGAVPEDHPDRPAYLSSLGDALRDRFVRYGRREDLEEAVEACRQAVAAIPGDHSDRPALLSNLGNALQDRSGRFGRREDLDEAIEAYRQAVGAVPTGHSAKPPLLSNLGLALQDRFRRGGPTEDLDEAIEAAREAVGATPEDHPDWPRYLSNLGNALQDLSWRYGGEEDLDEAVEAAREAVGATPEDHPDWPRYLSNLGNALQDLSWRYGGEGDLDEAVEAYRQAVGAVPEGHPDRPGYLSSLGLALRDRFVRYGGEGDLEEAVEAYRQAVGAVPEDHPDRSGYLSSLGTALHVRFVQFGLSEDLDEAVALARMAAGEVWAPVEVRVHAAWDWGRWAVTGRRWDEAVEAFGEAVELAGSLAPQELGREDQEYRLGDLSGLGSEAAAACVQAGQMDRAVELFEQGRAVLFSRVLDARSDLTGLQRLHPDLAERFIQWRDELERPDPSPVEGQEGRAALRMAAERRRKASAEFARVRDEIRKRPRFERFLMPRPVKDLLLAAADGPVVLLSVASLRSDALILTRNGVEVLPLDAIDLDKVAEQVDVFLGALAVLHDLAPSEASHTASEAALAGVLAWLGERVTGPVLDHLGYTGAPAPGMPWPRVWWCPSGALSLLPLHAAGHHDAARTRLDAVIDRVVSSTVPTVRALLRARQAPQQDPEPRLLVVAMPRTPGQADLPGAADEADTLRETFAGQVEVLGLPGTGPADYETVMAALPGHPWVHFSCHGQSDLSDPSASHLLLADYQSRPLTVLDLTGARLQQAELAFLSACSTARTGNALPDEPIHLAAACQLAGYRHVIASLWPIGDADTAWLTRHFYTIYIEDGGTADAAAALHQATRKLREIHRPRPGRWAPYLHTGP